MASASASSLEHPTTTAWPPPPTAPPYGMPAAAVAAALLDSRPSTSTSSSSSALADDEHGGGVALTDPHILPPAPSLQPLQVPHISSSISAMEHEYFTPSSHALIDQHAAALEALSMEHAATPPLPAAAAVAASVLSSAFAPSTYSTLEATQSAQDDHQAILDVTAFVDIVNYVHHYCHPKRAVKPMWEDDDRMDVITREDLLGDRRDFQGIDWTERMPRAEVRKRRAGFERSRLAHRTVPGRRQHRTQLANSESFLSFKRLDKRHRPTAPHFQLRNMVAATSRNDIFYAARNTVVRTDAYGGAHDTIIDVRKRRVNGQACTVTTLAASDNVLIAGGFEGEYMLADLASPEPNPTGYTFGLIKDWDPSSHSHINNHVHLFPSRSSYTPTAVLASNDSHLRLLDTPTNTFTSVFSFPAAVNCSATSPDARLRVVVGDFQETLITNAETGAVLQSLAHHTEDSFACAWSDNGIHVATAAQDHTIAVWDARNWSLPVASLASELSVPRVLKFTPQGAGHPILAVGEADDYIDFIDARTFDAKQSFDFFGSCTGIAALSTGEVFVGNGETRFGGLVEFERTGEGWLGPRRTDDDMDLDADWDCGYSSDAESVGTLSGCGNQNENRSRLDHAMRRAVYNELGRVAV